MNKYILIFLTLFLLKSCQSKTKIDNGIYKQKVQQELNSGVKVDEIFMTFKFGDSKDAVNQKFKQLLSDSKISLDAKGQYIYNFIFDEYEHNNAYGTFHQNFHSNKLYQFRILVRPTDDMKALGLGEGSREFIKQETVGLLYLLTSLYMDKYGVPVEKNNILFDEPSFYWINGNREISLIRAENFVNIYYNDLITINSIEVEEKNKLLDDANKTKIDI